MANTLLVLGNGFDMKCGLKSSFRDFIWSDYYSECRKACEDTVSCIKRCLETHSHDESFLFISFANISFWDLYFALPFLLELDKYDDWSDFEQRLSDFVCDMQRAFNVDEVVGRSALSIDRENRYRFVIKAKWDDIEDRIDNKKQMYYFILNRYLYNKVGELFLTAIVKKKVDGILFKELKEYERCFGAYIYTLQNKSGEYLIYAGNVINQLVAQGHTLVCLNTFNYSDLSSEIPPQCEMWYVNGDGDNPIFGIDIPDVESTDNLGYKYTKTYRRLELDNRRKWLFPQNKDFNRIVVYGHSLSKQDYSYFYALFIQMGVAVSLSKKDNYVLEFAYSVYGEKKSEEVKRETIERVLRLLKSYSSEVLHETNFRLMDVLHINGAIKFTEIY